MAGHAAIMRFAGHAIGRSEVGFGPEISEAIGFWPPIIGYTTGFGPGL